MRIGDKEFNLRHRTYIMGILNVTPDSFSDGGKFNEFEAALVQARKLIEDGADIIDIGGESTRPGAEYVSEEEEIKRVVTIIEAIKSELDVIISIDTYKSKTAEAAVKAGADIINLMQDVKADLQESIDIALSAGVKKENIILDPGIGFAKTYEENLIVMNNCNEIKDMGYPVLLGTSRKSMIGLTLNLPVNERVEGTVATTVIGIMKGMNFIRVHDVLENKRAAVMTDTIIKAK